MSHQRFLTDDGSHSLLSSSFGVSYHSRHGAVQETQHVFIEAALLQKLPNASHLNILGIGFGTGLNAFMTYLESRSYACQIRYHAVEAFPITTEEARQLNYPEILNATTEADIFAQMHEQSWDEDFQLSDRFTLQKQFRHFDEVVAENFYDLIYFDAFAPSAQPELWEEPLLYKMHQALAPQGILTTYCAKGVVKRQLKAIGFTVEAIPGPPGKREMTRAIKAF